ncbi:MAG: OmpH family outer membrane protein [Thermodesulfovibrionales bacterium]|nr:OmpH family outer membrane protein [Thermodesulfovibrionales bacterium]
MKKILVVTLLGLFMFASSSAALSAETLKIGIIDLFKALNESDAGKRAKADLESLQKSKEVVIDEKKKNIEKLRAEIEKQASIMSSEARKTKQEELERVERDFQRIVTDANAELQKKLRELESEILKELVETVNKTGKEEGYSMILERRDIPYFNQALDITDKVIKKYNESKKK